MSIESASAPTRTTTSGAVLQVLEGGAEEAPRPGEAGWYESWSDLATWPAGPTPHRSLRWVWFRAAVRRSVARTERPSAQQTRPVVQQRRLRAV